MRVQGFFTAAMLSAGFLQLGLFRHGWRYWRAFALVLHLLPPSPRRRNRNCGAAFYLLGWCGYLV